jgi:6-phosphofructokinase 1
VGLVKLMGWSAGHIALHATLSSRDVGCYTSSQNFYLRGAGGLFEFLYRRLREKSHAMGVVANGAGPRFIPRPDPQQQNDESGDPAFLDVGARGSRPSWGRGRRRSTPGSCSR